MEPIFQVTYETLGHQDVRIRNYDEIRVRTHSIVY